MSENNTAVSIQKERLCARLAESLAGSFGDQSGEWRQNLKELARDLKSALSAEGLAETPRRSSFFELVRDIDRETHENPQGEAIAAYFTVLAFCETYLVDWYVVGAGTG